MKHCVNCGAELQDEAVFCTSCGSQADSVQDAAPQPEPAPEYTYQQPQQVVSAAEPKGKAIATLILGIASLVCAVFGWTITCGIIAVICGIVGLILGKKAVAEAPNVKMGKTGKTLALIGLILGAILLVVGIIVVAACASGSY